MKKTVSLILLCVFGWLFGLFLFEIVAYLPLKKIRDSGRIIIKNQDAATMVDSIQSVQYDKLLGWRGVTGAKGLKESSEFKMWVTINSKGFRDEEHTDLSGRGLYRIVALGDSFVWGWGVEQKDRFTDILESLLENKGIETEVINLGVPGYGTDHEYLLFQSEGIKYKPNLVVLGLFSNDIDTNPLRTMSYYQKPVFRFTKSGTLRLTNVPVPIQNSISIWLKCHSSIYYLYTVFLERSSLFRNLCINVGLIEDEEHIKLLRAVYPIGLSNNVGLIEDEEHIKQQAVPLTKELLRSLSNLVKQNNSELLVVLVPDRREVNNVQRNGDFTAISAFVKNELRSHVLDLRPLLFKDTGKYYFEVDVHWTAEGHRVAADAIFAYLVENRFLPQNRSATK